MEQSTNTKHAISVRALVISQGDNNDTRRCAKVKTTQSKSEEECSCGMNVSYARLREPHDGCRKPLDGECFHQHTVDDTIHTHISHERQYTRKTHNSATRKRVTKASVNNKCLISTRLKQEGQTEDDGDDDDDKNCVH